jgi:type II secretory pathway component GspD/PulD (secretin)
MHNLRKAVGPLILTGTILLLADPANASDAPSGKARVVVEFRILDMPTATARTKVLAAGSGMTEAEVARLLDVPGVKVEAAPRITTLIGQNAEITIAEERLFVTGFETAPEGWEPVTERFEVGLRITCRVRGAPAEPDRLLADVVVALSRVEDVMEQQVSPAGADEPMRVALPIISRHELTTSVRARPGEATVLGGVERPSDGEDRTTVVLMRLEAVPSGARADDAPP